MGRRRRLLLLGVLIVASCTACRVNVEVGLEARADGSGQVRVDVVADKEVAEAVDLSEGVRVEDLKQAGWTIDGPMTRSDGSVEVVATKPFRDVSGARIAIDEISGADGPFQGFRLERRRGFARTTTRLVGTVDFSKGIEAFGDAGVRQALGGSDIGVDLKRLEQSLNGPLDRAVGVQVAVRLPGAVDSNAPTQRDNGARWELHLHDRAELMASSQAWNTANLGGAAAAALVLVGLLVFMMGRRR